MSWARLGTWAAIQLALVGAFAWSLRCDHPAWGALALVVLVLHRRPEW